MLMNPDSHSVLALLTPKSAQQILEEGGAGPFLLDPNHAKRCRYAVLCHATDWAESDKPRGSAFMVGVINGVEPSPEDPERWLVRFRKYTPYSRPGAWQGWKNPVKYTNLASLFIPTSELKFQEMPDVAYTVAPTLNAGRGLTLAEARRGLALTFGVEESAVEITIRG